MTHLSFTSGEILDIISALEDKAEKAEESGKFILASYYFNIIQQFDIVDNKLKDYQPENKVANLILALN